MFKDNVFIDASSLLINSSSIKKDESVTDYIKVNDIELNSKDAKVINRNKGKYITITFEKENISNELEILLDLIVNSIKDMLKYLKVNKSSRVLFVGLGNKDFACDAFGYKVIEKLNISNNTFKMYKDVMGKTNIKSTSFIRNLANLIDSDLVIVFDSLKANDISRLGSTIQIATTGLCLGSAYIDTKVVIDKSTIKRPVINIGIPTIINLKSIEKDMPSLIVSTNNVDELVDDTSTIISIALNRLF